MIFALCFEACVIGELTLKMNWLRFIILNPSSLLIIWKIIMDNMNGGKNVLSFQL